MYKYLLTIFLIVIVGDVNAQIKIGFRSGAGVFIDLGNLDILESKDNNTYIFPKVSEFGTPLPRPADEKRIYFDFTHQHEVFATLNRNILKFGVGFVRRPRPYSDLLELFWGENEDQRYVHYTLTFGRKIIERSPWSLDLNTGLIAEKFFVTRTTYTYYKDDSGNIIIGGLDINTSGRDPDQFNWGIPVEANLQFKINSNASVVLQTKTYYLIGIGIDGMYVSPMIKITF